VVPGPRSLRYVRCTHVRCARRAHKLFIPIIYFLLSMKECFEPRNFRNQMYACSECSRTHCVQVHWCTDVLVYSLVYRCVQSYSLVYRCMRAVVLIGVQMYWCTDVLVYSLGTDVLVYSFMYRCNGVQVHWCTDVLVYSLVYRCIGVLIGVQMYWCTGTLVYRCMCAVVLIGVKMYACSRTRWCTGAQFTLITRCTHICPWCDGYTNLHNDVIIAGLSKCLYNHLFNYSISQSDIDIDMCVVYKQCLSGEYREKLCVLLY